MSMNKDPVNPVIKVYGHHRSGNNYLCALMYRNFYSGLKSAGRLINRGKRDFYLFGEKIKEKKFFHPYGNIVGSHDPKDCTPDSIYIIRNSDDVEKSIATLEHKIWSPYPHCLHVYIATQGRPYIVYYEDLKAHPEKILREIQVRFGLNRLYRAFIIDVGYCGWKT